MTDTGNLNRRAFIGAAGAFAFAPVPGRIFAADERPLFRMGVMTDTHVGRTRESCSRVQAALGLFRRIGVDLIVNNGDIADHYYPEGYRALREIYSETYPDPALRPREIWVYAWHDAFEFMPGAPREDTTRHADAAFAEVRRLLEAKDPVTTAFEFHGIPMLVFNQFDRPETFERMISTAIADHPGKPIFVFSHVPPSGTVYNSWRWGSWFQREIYDRHPQVVDFSGHVHGSLRNDLFIWQKDFTVINSGCLQVWGGIPVNSRRISKSEYGVLTVDVFPDRLLVHRHDVRTGEEIEPDAPWNVALPFAAATANYTVERKRARAAVPQYPKDARLSVVADGHGTLTLAFPEVAGRPRAFLHRVTIERQTADGGWAPLTRREVFGDYHLKDCETEVKVAFSRGFFEPGERIRLKAQPLNAYGIPGEALTLDFTVPTPREIAETLLDRPWSEGEFPLAMRPSRFMDLPPTVAPAGSSLILACDVRTELPEDCAPFDLGVVNAVSGEKLTAPVFSPLGDSGVMRYVFEYRQPKAGGCRLLFAHGARNGRVTVSRVRLLKDSDPRRAKA